MLQPPPSLAQHPGLLTSLTSSSLSSIGLNLGLMGESSPPSKDLSVFMFPKAGSPALL